ncbi:MAG: hypothetical protein R2941_02130 [Desulfobacterales bacterium]
MVPSYVAANRDDPVIPADDLALLSLSAWRRDPMGRTLRIHTKYGSEQLEKTHG